MYRRERKGLLQVDIALTVLNRQLMLLIVLDQLGYTTKSGQVQRGGTRCLTDLPLTRFVTLLDEDMLDALLNCRQ